MECDRKLIFYESDGIVLKELVRVSLAEICFNWRIKRK